MFMGRNKRGQRLMPPHDGDVLSLLNDAVQYPPELPAHLDGGHCRFHDYYIDCYSEYVNEAAE